MRVDSPHPKWEVEVAPGKWSVQPASLQAALFAKMALGEENLEYTWDYGIHGNQAGIRFEKYNFHLGRFTQMNLRTKFVRRIRCLGLGKWQVEVAHDNWETQPADLQKALFETEKQEMNVLDYTWDYGPAAEQDGNRYTPYRFDLKDFTHTNLRTNFVRRIRYKYDAASAAHVINDAMIPRIAAIIDVN